MNNTDKHPMHIFKYCPRCGSNHFTFDGKKRFTCNHCNFIYYINAVTAVAVIIKLPDGKILLTRRKFNPAAGKYDLPGGFVDPGERAEVAAMREIKEELDIEISDLQFIASFPNTYEYGGINYFTCDIAFVAPYNGSQYFKAYDDVDDFLLIEPHEINFEVISFDSIRKILKFYIENYI